jgi:thioredoxin reductase (NADPH)
MDYPSCVSKISEEPMRPMANLFVMFFAEPNTEWLDGCLALGLVETGHDYSDQALALPFATNKPGISCRG